jgi:hypothetical protein
MSARVRCVASVIYELPPELCSSSSTEPRPVSIGMSGHGSRRSINRQTRLQSAASQQQCAVGQRVCPPATRHERRRIELRHDGGSEDAVTGTQRHAVEH